MDVRRDLGGIRLVGADCPRWRVAGDALACCESAIWRDRNTEEVRARSGMPTTHIGWPWSRRRVRNCGCSASSTGRSPASSPDGLACTNSVRSHPSTREACLWSLLLVVAANVLVFGHPRAPLPTAASVLPKLWCMYRRLSVFPLSHSADSAGPRWRVRPGRRSAAARAGDAPGGALQSGSRVADAKPAREIRLRDVTFAYTPSGNAVLENFDLTIPAGSSLAIVGQNGAGKTTIAKLLCRLYDPQPGAIEVDGVDIREFDVASWRSRITAVFQDFMRLELPLRIMPAGAPDNVCAPLSKRQERRIWRDWTPCLPVGTPDLSGGQWQRVALARALAAVKSGAGVVLLDEPTAQLDVRGEADLRSAARCDTALYDHPDFTSLLDRPPRRSHLCTRTRPGSRARYTRRADCVGRALSNDVRSAGATLQHRR